MDKCKTCQIERPLKYCDKCYNELIVSVVHRLQEEKIEDKFMRKLENLEGEIKALRESLDELKIRGFKLRVSKPKLDWDDLFPDSSSVEKPKGDSQ